MLFLKSISTKYTAFNNFKYPNKIGETISAPDWIPNDKCSNGLHGLKIDLINQNVELLSWKKDAIWIVVEADNFICLGSKYKFESCTIRFIEDKNKILHESRMDVINYMIENGSDSAKLNKIMKWYSYLINN